MPRRRDVGLLKDVGRRLARIRKDRGWTQEQLADKIGIAPVTLSRLETGARAMSLSSLSVIAKQLDVELGDVLDVKAPAPAQTLPPRENEMLRLFRETPSDRQDLLLKVARELAD